MDVNKKQNGNYIYVIYYIQYTLFKKSPIFKVQPKKVVYILIIYGKS